MSNQEIKRDTLTIDATGRSLGRLASEIATLLRGKQKPSWQPHLDGGDFVNIQNIDQMVITGKKETDKVYYRHSGYPGGLKEATYKERVAKEGHAPILVDAVKNMIPNNRLRQHMIKRLTFKQENN